MEKEISFEDGIRRIEEILEKLENGNSGLAETLSLYEEGMLLLNRCNSMLEYAEQKVEILKSSFEENPITASFSGEKVNEDQ